MAGLFSGLEIGKRALATHQLWLNTIGHNIANVNTPGYTRQRVSITPTLPFEDARGLVGTGVKAVNIYQVRDLFLNQQYIQENKALGRWSSMDKTLSQIEALFAEPGDNSLGSLMTQFWNSWSSLANDIVAGTESTGARNSLKENSNLLTAEFHRIHEQLTDLQTSINDDIRLTVDKVNVLTEEIALLNTQITRYEVGGDNANDLRDRRGLLIDYLSEYVDVNVREQSNGSAIVYIGAMTIVDSTASYRIGTYKSGAGGSAIDKIAWEGTTKDIKILDGQLKGLIDARDSVIPDYLNKLDEMAFGLVTNVNALHRIGYGLDGTTTGLNFFNPAGVSASNIAVSSQIEDDINLIAASLTGERGDNQNALAILELRNSLLMSRNTATITEYYQSMIGEVGVDAGKASSLRSNLELLTAQVDNARMSVQGVSLNEEMTQMIKFQHAFDAAARIITTMDQALDTVINGMGVVGR